MLVFDLILQGHEASEENARGLAQCGAAIGESEVSEQSIKYARFIDSLNGVDIYYDFGADYYFFSPS